VPAAPGGDEGPAHTLQDAGADDAAGDPEHDASADHGTRSAAQDAAASAAPARDDHPAPPADAPDPADPRPFAVPVPGAVVSLEFVPVPLGGADDAPVLWFGRTEVTWDAFDAYVFRLDDREAPPDPEVDALARPSNPFALADRGYGHAGHPAISVSHRAAASFAEWLAARTGLALRLPTAREWTLACAADGGTPSERRQLDAKAWTVRNAGGTTHPVAALEPGDAGLHDLLGNVAEWCDAASGPPVLMGGHYDARPDAVGCAARLPDDPSFNATDPQIPKSPWWLADGPFAGFRLVCEAPAGAR